MCSQKPLLIKISFAHTALLSSTRDPDASNVTMAGECLGILGAADPGRLVGNNADLSAANADVDCVPLAVTEETFVVDLVNVLIRDHPHMAFVLPAI